MTRPPRSPSTSLHPTTTQAGAPESMTDLLCLHLAFWQESAAVTGESSQEQQDPEDHYHKRPGTQEVGPWKLRRQLGMGFREGSSADGVSLGAQVSPWWEAILVSHLPGTPAASLCSSRLEGRPRHLGDRSCY